MEIEEIRKLVKEKKYAISKHAFAEAFTDGFSIADILTAIFNGEIIERYNDRNRCLIYAKLSLGPIHVVVAYSNLDYLWIVTIYKPDPDEWVDDRKRK